MRTREEVLTVEAINDRLRELEAQLVSKPYTLAASEPVAITDAMVEAAAKALFLDDDISHSMTWDDASPRLVKEYKAYARIAITAALTVASEGASDA